MYDNRSGVFEGFKFCGFICVGGRSVGKCFRRAGGSGSVLVLSTSIKDLTLSLKQGDLCFCRIPVPHIEHYMFENFLGAPVRVDFNIFHPSYKKCRMQRKMSSLACYFVDTR